MTELRLHPALEPLADFIGTWRGSGRGEYPNVDDFNYEEEVTFTNTGRPLLFYVQRTWNPVSGAPMHSEAGYWRPQEDGGIEVILAHSLGVGEVSEGTAAPGRINVESTTLVSSSTAKQITALARDLRIEDDILTYELKMAYGDVPLQHHLGAELRRAR